MDGIENREPFLENSETESSDALMELAREAGFEAVGATAASRLSVKPEVRDMCAADRCRAYDRSWVCPPACGSLDAFAEAIASKETALVVQTVATLEDEFDIEGMQEAEALHKRRFAQFARNACDILGASLEKGAAFGSTDGRKREEGALLFLAAGGCTVCPSCTYPDAACRFPDKAFVSVEAAGLVVSEVCESANIPYHHGKGTIAYTSCVLR